MFFHYLTLSFIVSNSYLKCYKKHFENIRFERSHIRFNNKQWETCSETFFKNNKIESNSRFLKYYLRVYLR